MVDKIWQGGKGGQGGQGDQGCKKGQDHFKLNKKNLNFTPGVNLNFLFFFHHDNKITYFNTCCNFFLFFPCNKTFSNLKFHPLQQEMLDFVHFNFFFTRQHTKKNLTPWSRFKKKLSYINQILNSPLQQKILLFFPFNMKISNFNSSRRKIWIFSSVKH